jgi:peroxiredoxin
MELIGETAPPFTLPDQNDKMVKLIEGKGKWIVLAFYPADGTMG